MAKTRLYEIDGMQIEIPLRWDTLAKKYLEVYDELIDNPKRTPLGYPIVTVMEEACSFAPDGVTGCRNCPNYQAAGKRKTWFGSCRNEQNRIQAQEGGNIK